MKNTKEKSRSVEIDEIKTQSLEKGYLMQIFIVLQETPVPHDRSLIHKHIRRRIDGNGNSFHLLHHEEMREEKRNKTLERERINKKGDRGREI